MYGGHQLSILRLVLSFDVVRNNLGTMSLAEISENLGVTVSFDRVLREEYSITVERQLEDVVLNLPSEVRRYSNDRFDSVFLAVRSNLYDKVIKADPTLSIFTLGHLSLSSNFVPELALTGLDFYAITTALEESNIPNKVKSMFREIGGPLKPWVKFARLQQGLHMLRLLPPMAVQLEGFSEIALPEVTPIDLLAGKVGSFVSAFPLNIELGNAYHVVREGNKTFVYPRKTVFELFGLDYVCCDVPDFQLTKAVRPPPSSEPEISAREYFALTDDQAVNFFTGHWQSEKGRNGIKDQDSLICYDYGSKAGQELWATISKRVQREFFQMFRKVSSDSKTVGEIITILAETLFPEADRQIARLLVAARLLAQRGQLAFAGGCLRAK